MMPGQRIEIDEEVDAPCRCMAVACAHEGGACGSRPARDLMLSGWPDAITLCDRCSAKDRRLELDLTRHCALCGGPLVTHSKDGTVERRGCICNAEISRCERELRKLMDGAMGG